MAPCMSMRFVSVTAALVRNSESVRESRLVGLGSGEANPGSLK